MVQVNTMPNYQAYNSSEVSSDGSIKISIWFRPETIKVLSHIHKTNQLGVLEDSINWLIEGWQLNQHQQFDWSFNQCTRPKFWFGQRVLHKPTGIMGEIVAIHWRRLGTTPGFWYGVARAGTSAQWMSELVLELSESERSNTSD